MKFLTMKNIVPVSGVSRIAKAMSGLVTLQSELQKGIVEINQEKQFVEDAIADLQNEKLHLTEKGNQAAEALTNVQKILPKDLVD